MTSSGEFIAEISPSLVKLGFPLLLYWVVSPFSTFATKSSMLSQLLKFGPKGSRAPITGGSDGIGQEFSLQLAAMGFDVVLVSLTQSKLATLAQQIGSEHSGIGTGTLAMDIAKNDQVDYERWRALVKDLDIAILITNVTQSHDIFVSFLGNGRKGDG